VDSLQSGHMSTTDLLRGREHPPARDRRPNHWPGCQGTTAKMCEQ